MEDKEFIDFIKNQIETNPQGYRKKLSVYTDRIDNLLEVFLDFKPEKLSEALYCLVNNIKKPEMCIVCNENYKTFRSISKGYGPSCSVKCNAKLGGIGRSRAEPSKHLEKMKKTNLERYGTEFPLQIQSVKEKQEETMLKRYGAKHSVHSKILIEKTKNTVRERYGVDYYYQSDESRKRSSDMQKKKIKDDFYKRYFRENYRVRSWLQTEEGLLNQLRERNCENILYNIEDYLDGRTFSEIADDIGITDYMLKKIIDFRSIDYKPRHLISSFEREIRNIVESYIDSTDIVYNDRTILDGKELDIFIPSLNLAIECHGVFWHTDRYKNKNYHFDKWKGCFDNNITLLQITDIDFYEKTDIWKSVLKYKLGAFDSCRIYARNTEIRTVNNKESKDFINKHHLQGNTPAKFKYGLFHKGKLVSIATFSKSRYNKKHDYELIRFCSSTNVIGGFSKLIKHFENSHMQENEDLLSYANCFWSIGDVYRKNNFTYEGHTGANYYWTDSKIKISREKAMKYKLIETFGEENVESEKQFMTDYINMRKFHDAGNMKWVYTKKGGT